MTEDIEPSLAYDFAIEVATEAIKKQAPMQPMRKHGGYHCAECGCKLLYIDRYCPRCGQRIDWSNDENRRSLE